MLKFENPSNGRYYYIQVGTDILNDMCVTIIRGGKNYRVVRHFGFNSFDKIQSEINRLTKIRVRRGYKVID